jgi:hypothetical protein
MHACKMLVHHNKNAECLKSTQGFDAKSKTVNELFRGSKPIIGPVQVLEKKSE